MKQVLFLTLFNFSFGLLAQETVKKTVTSDSPIYKEVYRVLKSNQEIKQGDYKKTAEFFAVKGQYDDNVKVGIWTFYDKDGKVEQKIDFDSRKVIFSIPFDILVKSFILTDNQVSEQKPDEAPIFIGGLSAMGQYTRNLRYPKEARNNRIQGKVYISATITKEGKMIDEEIDTGPGFGLNEEGLRVIQQIPDDWIPGTLNGQNVDVRIWLPITFQMG